MASVIPKRRLIAERTRDGIAVAPAEGRKPGRRPLDHEKLQAAVTLVRSGLAPTKAARQVGLGRSTLYHELALMPNDPRQPAKRTRLQRFPHILFGARACLTVLPSRPLENGVRFVQTKFLGLLEPKPGTCMLPFHCVRDLTCSFLF